MVPEGTGLKMFDGEKAPKNFIADLNEICKMDTDTIKCVLKMYAPSLYIEPDELYTEISKECKIDQRSVKAIVRISSLLYLNIKNEIFHTDDLRDDFKRLNFENVFDMMIEVYEINGLEFVKKLEDFKIISRESSTVLPNYTSLEYNINMRRIPDDEGNVVTWVPIAQICLNTFKYGGVNENPNNVCFQTTISGINHLIKALNRLKGEMKEAESLRIG